MNKLIAGLIASLFAFGAYAATPVAATAGAPAVSAAKADTGTKKASAHKHVKKSKKVAAKPAA